MTALAALGKSGPAYPRRVPGAVILVVAMLVVLPSALFAAGAVWSALLGASLNSAVSDGAEGANRADGTDGESAAGGSSAGSAG